MKAGKTTKWYIRPSIAAAAIIAVVFSHFAVSQFIFFENEKDSVIGEAVNKQTVENKTESDAKKPDVAVAPKNNASVSFIARPQEIAPEQTTVKQTVIKKKQAPRESRAERLRRAEKLLTGV